MAKRKYNESYIKFGFTSLIDQGVEKGCSELIAANCLSYMHLFDISFPRMYFFTRYISLAADSVCSAFPLTAQRLPAPKTTACNNFAFLSIFFMYRLSVVPPRTDRWLIAPSMSFV